MDEEGGNSQFVGPYLVPFLNQSGWVSAADDWQQYGFPSKDAMLRYVMQGDYITHTQTDQDGRPYTYYESASGNMSRPPSWQFWDDGGTWFDTALTAVVLGMATAGVGSGIGAALGAGAGAAGGTAGAIGGTAAEAAAAGAITAGEISGASALGTGGAIGGGIGTAGATLSASELASLGYSAADMAALGVPAADIAASTAGVGGAVAGSTGLQAGLGADGTLSGSLDGADVFSQLATGSETPYNFDLGTGDTVGPGGTPSSNLSLEGGATLDAAPTTTPSTTGNFGSTNPGGLDGPMGDTMPNYTAQTGSGSGSTPGLLDKAFDWVNQNKTLASLGTQLVGGLIQGAAAPSVARAKAQAEAQAQKDIELARLQNTSGAGTRFRIRPTGKMLRTPGLIRSGMS